MGEDAVMNEPSTFPNLSSLSPLLTMKTIGHYPKLSLLLYDSLKPFMCIFDNEYLSFIDVCSKEKLLDFNNFQINSSQADFSKLRNSRGLIRRFSQHTPGRQQAIMNYTKNYK